MKKILMFIISVLAFAYSAKCQHQIITVNNDTIVGNIRGLSDNTYTYWRLTKPRGLREISKSDVKQLIAIGPDTLYNISTTTIANAYEKDTASNDIDYSNNVADSLKSSAYYLRKSGENLMAAKVIFITTSIVSLVIASNDPKNTAYVVAGGSILGTIIEFIGIQHLINAGDKLKQEEFLRNKKKN